MQKILYSFPFSSTLGVPSAFKTGLLNKSSKVAFLNTTWGMPFSLKIALPFSSCASLKSPQASNTSITSLFPFFSRRFAAFRHFPGDNRSFSKAFLASFLWTDKLSNLKPKVLSILLWLNLSCFAFRKLSSKISTYLFAFSTVVIISSSIAIAAFWDLGIVCPLMFCSIFFSVNWLIMLVTYVVWLHNALGLKLCLSTPKRRLV